MPSDTGIHDYIAGAIGGTAGLIVGHPFDTTKVQLQTQHGSKKYKGTRDAIKRIVNAGNSKGLFRGLSWPLLNQGLVNSVIFGVYGSTLTFLEPDKNKRESDYGRIFFAGGVAGGAQLIILTPVDYIKVVLQSQIGSHVENKDQRRRFFKGPMECAAAIYEKSGIRGFYKGGLALAFRDVPGFGIYYTSYVSLSDVMHRYKLTDVNGVVADLISGGFAGCMCWVTTMPFDAIKSRYQADFAGKYKGFVHCAKSLYREGGMGIFFRGCLITCLRAFPVNAIIFLVYSRSLKYMEANF